MIEKNPLASSFSFEIKDDFIQLTFLKNLHTDQILDQTTLVEKNFMEVLNDTENSYRVLVDVRKTAKKQERIPRDAIKIYQNLAGKAGMIQAAVLGPSNAKATVYKVILNIMFLSNGKVDYFSDEDRAREWLGLKSSRVKY